MIILLNNSDIGNTFSNCPLHFLFSKFNYSVKYRQYSLISNSFLFLFVGSRAVDALLSSEFVTREEPLFKTREDICDFLHVMLIHKFFHRALKVPIDELQLKGKKGKKKDKKVTEIPDENKKEKKDKGTDAESSVVEGSKEQQVRSQIILLNMFINSYFARCYHQTFIFSKKKKSARRKLDWTCIMTKDL